MSQTLFAPIPANFNGNTYHTSGADANLISRAKDRRLDTYTDENDLVLDTSDNTSVTHLWVKGKDITQIEITISGSVVLTQTETADAVEDAQGNDADWEQEGFQNFLQDIRDTANDPLVPRTAPIFGFIRFLRFLRWSRFLVDG